MAGKIADLRPWMQSRRCGQPLTITVISPQVTLFTRGEGFFENTLFSDPTGWSSLTLSERRDALARTDRGVFSARVQDALLADDRIRHLRGRVAHAVARDERIRLTLSTDRGSERLETVHGFDLVIDGSGADPLWFVPLPGRAGSARTWARRPADRGRATGIHRL